jgi:flotillin
MGATTLLTSLVVIGIVLLFAYVLVRSRYKKAGPDEALIVYGRRKFFGKKVRGDKGEIEGFRIVRGGGTFVWPAWEQYEKLSLRMMTLDIDLRHVYTARRWPRSRSPETSSISAARPRVFSVCHRSRSRARSRKP